MTMTTGTPAEAEENLSDDGLEDSAESEPLEPDSRAHYLLLLVLGIASPLLVLAKQAQYGLTFPYWDAWRFGELLQSFDAGNGRLLEFWAQHNEHRILFPRLMMFALAKLSGWNVAWELGASVVFAVGMFALVCWLLARTGNQLPVLHRSLGAVLAATFIFSWTQNENWVWGFQSNVWMLIFHVVLGVAVLSSGLPYALRVFLAILCGVVATYSYANGLLYWPAVALLLWDLRVPRQQRIAGCVAWGLALGLVAESYFIGYTRPEVSPSLLTPLEHPLLFVQFLAAFLGAPVSTFFVMPAWHGVDSPPPAWALLPGPAAVLALAAIAWRDWRAARDWNALAPWIALAAFALGSAAIASAGRCGFGLGQALTSRYITITTLLWISLIALALRAAARGEWLEEARARSLGIGLAAVFVLTALYGAASSSAPHEQRCHWKRMGWLALRTGYLNPLFLRDLSDRPDELAERYLPWMFERKLGGVGVPVEDPKAVAAQFLRDAQQLAAMRPQPLLLHAGIYADVAARFDPECPGLAAFQEQLRAASAAGATSAGSAPQTAGSAAGQSQSAGGQ